MTNQQFQAIETALDSTRYHRLPELTRSMKGLIKRYRSENVAFEERRTILASLRLKVLQHTPLAGLTEDEMDELQARLAGYTEVGA